MPRISSTTSLSNTIHFIRQKYEQKVNDVKMTGKPAEWRGSEENCTDSVVLLFSDVAHVLFRVENDKNHNKYREYFDGLANDFKKPNPTTLTSANVETDDSWNNDEKKMMNCWWQLPDNESIV